MAVSLKHSKTSTKADGTNTDLVQPSDWNAEHTLTLAAGKVLGRASDAGDGAAQELPIAVATDGTTVISANSSTNALRITQTGTGNALVVEDSANPDSTPFVVTAAGSIGIGTAAPTSQLNIYNATATQLHIQGDAAANIIASRASSDAGAPTNTLRKSRGTTASPSAVASSDLVGNFAFAAFGGTNYRSIAAITTAVDTYTSDTDISSNMRFSTSPAGSASAVERMRIDSSGALLINTTTNPVSARLHISTTSNPRTLQLTATDADSSVGFGLANDAVEWGNVVRADASDAFIIRNITSNTDVATFATGGNVGIGTTSPSEKLDVAGNVAVTGTARRITGDTANATIANRLLFQDSTTDSLSAFGIIPNGTADSTYVQLFNSSTPDNSSFLNLFAGPTRTSIASAKIGTGSYLPLIFATGGADRVAIDTSGNVGIGTNTPNAGTKLHVAGGELLIEGTSGNLSTLRYSYNGTNRATTYWSESVTRLITALNGAGDFQWSSNNTQRMILDSSGNLGINQSSPAAKLDISGGVATNIVAVAASAIDCSLGNFFTKTATGALTWTFSNVPASRAFTVILELTNGGTGAQSWPAAVKWPGGTAPTLMTSGVDVLGFITDDGGTTWRGSLLMKDSR